MKRSGNKCERCGVRNHSVGYRDQDGLFHPLRGNLFLEDYGVGIDPHTGKELEYLKAKGLAGFHTEHDEMGNKYIVIVLTMAHLDHIPENCHPSNLMMLCQRCHNRHDILQRKQTRRENGMENQLILEI